MSEESWINPKLMVQCQICLKQLPDRLIFSLYRSGHYYLEDQYQGKANPTLLIWQQNGYYLACCSNQCSNQKTITQNKEQSFVEEHFDLIFKKSQISNGIIRQIQNLNGLLKQEIALTENVYKQKAVIDFTEQSRIYISQSIKNVFDNLTNDLIKHLEECIKFSLSETEKINLIKQQVEKLLNEQGNINLLNHNRYLKLCEEDIQRYRIDEMTQLMEKLQQAKIQINRILNHNYEQEKKNE